MSDYIDNPQCKMCKYHGRFEFMTSCDYLLYTKKQRGCTGEFPCKRFKEGKPNARLINQITLKKNEHHHFYPYPQLKGQL